MNAAERVNIKEYCVIFFDANLGHGSGPIALLVGQVRIRVFGQVNRLESIVVQVSVNLLSED